jgi:hypothetical protein
VAVKVTDLSSVSGFSLTLTGSLPIAGGNASPALPNNTALVITKRTLQRGRSFRGRIFHPGLTENQVTANQVAGATVSALVAAYENFKGFTLTDGEAVLCVLSRYSGGNARVTGLMTPVENFTSDGFIDSQRRRLPGRGA